MLCKTTCLLIWPEEKEEENKDVITILTLKYWEIKYSFLYKISYFPFLVARVFLTPLCMLNSLINKYNTWFFIKYLELHTFPLNKNVCVRLYFLSSSQWLMNSYHSILEKNKKLLVAIEHIIFYKSIGKTCFRDFFLTKNPMIYHKITEFKTQQRP